ncbi:4'-phosphopantetheinyl transferase superfamily protein [Streptomyces harbinensis]|uniref:4'-phosphopantetheinyl transferase family protein n=1 Tax=Streptomyces harbinensis TaxID=1176198 RepID=UPI00339B6FEE
MSGAAATAARAPYRTGMAAGTVDVWHIRLPEPGAGAAGPAPLLDAGERARAARMATERDRLAFTVARTALRDILGRYLDRDPAALRFSAGRYGKPYVENAGLAFNLSHTRGAALLALAAPGPVGVDIERITGQDRTALAERWFRPAEAAAVRAAARAGDRAPFWAYWTCKESYVKALGLGLAHPLDRFEVRFAEATADAAVFEDGRHRAAWRMRRLDLPAGYAGAVTVRGPLTLLRTWSWTPGAAPATRPEGLSHHG